jgi:hypothetical protein
LINSCKEKDPELQLLSSQLLPYFSSASAIECYNNQLYIFGDDASYLLVLDSNYVIDDSTTYFIDTSHRIAKEIKPDIEAATLLDFGDQTYLYGFGSMSTTNRKMVYSFPIDSLRGFIKTVYFPKKISEIKEWNIEGAAFVKDQLLLVNRANTTNKNNYLLLETFIANKSKDSTSRAIKIDLPQQQNVIGASGLYYIDERDLLLFTASEEDTPNAFDDGIIGNSYLAVVKDFSKKMFRNSIAPDVLINLTNVNATFKQQKIESVCLEKFIGNNMILHLVADNDNGQSSIFKIRLTL